MQDAIDKISNTITCISMAGVTNTKTLETTYKELWESSESVLKPSHPEKIKVRLKTCLGLVFPVLSLVGTKILDSVETMESMV